MFIFCVLMMHCERSMTCLYVLGHDILYDKAQHAIVTDFEQANFYTSFTLAAAVIGWTGTRQLINLVGPSHDAYKSQSPDPFISQLSKTGQTKELLFLYFIRATSHTPTRGPGSPLNSSKSVDEFQRPLP